MNWNKKSENTIAKKRYNYPEYGFSFIYHDFQNPTLGEAYALNINYTFYFGKKSNKNQFYLRLGQGIAYNTNPFDLETNNKNVSLGSHLLANTTIGFNYRRRLTKAIDANLGILLNHYSNGSIKSPNVGLNLFSFSTGVSYNFDHENPIDYTQTPVDDIKIIEKEVNVGDFDLLINDQNLAIITNNVSNFTLFGKTQNFDINYASGQGKLLADKLEAQNITLFHRGTNDLLVNPIQEIKGEIRGTGNVISINRPPLAEVTEFYTGKLIFRD